MLLAVAIETEPTLTFGTPQVLFEGPFIFQTSGNTQYYDVAPDGRFLMLKPRGLTDEISGVTQIILVQNWHQELKERVPVP